VFRYDIHGCHGGDTIIVYNVVSMQEVFDLAMLIFEDIWFVFAFWFCRKL
jgi:hypothetical protein